MPIRIEMIKILLVEDDEGLRKKVAELLSTEFKVSETGTLADAQKKVESETFDLILLDGMLPDGDGFRFCSSLRSNESTRDVPVIFLTSRSAVDDKVMAFSLGAEDYIVKPFEGRELKARVQARLERGRKQRERGEILVKGKISIDLGSQRVTVQDKALDLTPLEFKILLCFAHNEDRVLSREQLISKAWGDGVHIVDRTVDSHVSALRRKLGDSGWEIVAVTGSGYRFCRRAGARAA